MHDGTMREGSTSRGESGRRPSRADAGSPSSGYTPLSEPRDEVGRSGWRAARGAARNSVVRRNWRVSAGVAGVVFLSMALTGFVAIFSTVKRERVPPTQVNEARVISPAAGKATPSSAQGPRETIDTCEQEIDRLTSQPCTYHCNGC